MSFIARARLGWCALLLSSFSVVGCSGETEPDVSDSGKYLIEARQAVAEGNDAKAREALDASIKAEPNLWAYMERAKLNAKQGQDPAALADCEEILKLNPENRDVPWIKGELKKAVDQRFKGASATPPSMRK